MMADIQGKILSKYGIDIAQENILKLYKADKEDISPQELQALIEQARMRWNQSVNGANEKMAERARARLEKADTYEAILKDDKLRKELFAYYNGGSGAGSGAQGSVPAGSLDFAREYFQLLETSKKIMKPDVEFFFQYYQGERKNKKAILEMLGKEFKVIGLGKDDKYAEEEVDDGPEGKKKDETSSLIVNLFQEATVLKLRKCVEFYESARQSEAVCQKYPAIREGLYEFLELKSLETIDQFSAYVTEKSKEFYAIRQERGQEFVPAVDLFNTLQALSGYRDVVDNFAEFKLLLRYPNLTPYMYSFTEMKKSTLKGIMEIANRDYVFRDDVDFILSYYNPVHDNFGITNSGIGDLIKRAEKKAKSNKVLNEIDEKLGRKKSRKLPFGAELMHWLAYWPIFLAYFVFEVFKTIFTQLHKLTIPVFLVVFAGANWLIPKHSAFENLWYLRKIMSKAEWYGYLYELFGETMESSVEAVSMSLAMIILMLAVYILPPLFAAIFVSEAASDLNKRYDWIGYERTFQNIFQKLRKKTEDQYAAHKQLYKKQKISKAVTNLVCLILVIAAVFAAPIGFRKFSEETGYFQKDEATERYLAELAERKEQSAREASSEAESAEEEPEIVMVITANAANIRSGPGTDYKSLLVASKGDTFISTGRGKEADNDRIWYEIYLDEKKEKKAWASESVIEIQKRR